MKNYNDNNNNNNKNFVLLVFSEAAKKNKNTIKIRIIRIRILDSWTRIECWLKLEWIKRERERQTKQNKYSKERISTKWVTRRKERWWWWLWSKKKNKKNFRANALPVCEFSSSLVVAGTSSEKKKNILYTQCVCGSNQALYIVASGKSKIYQVCFFVFPK